MIWIVFSDDHQNAPASVKNQSETDDKAKQVCLCSNNKTIQSTLSH